MGMAKTLLRQRGFGALLIILCFVGAQLAPTPVMSKEARISGTVSYRERIAMPPGYVVRVELLDISRQDAPSETLAAIELTRSHQVPVAYQLAFDESRIDPRHRYAVRAQIQVDGRLLFTSTQINLVITGGAAREANIWVQRIGSPKVDAEAASLTFAGEWLAEDIGGRGIIDNLQSTLRFDANALVSGLGGCNRFRGSYSSSGSNLRFGPLAATRIACVPAMMNQEARFFAALAGVRSTRIEGPFLLLYSADGTQLVKLIRL
jgi:putative lipoprotein